MKALFLMSIPELIAAMNNPHYSYGYRQECWRTLCRRCAED